MRKTCPRCKKRVRVNAIRCRGCGYAFPEGRGPRPVGLAMGVGFPLLMMGTVTLLIKQAPTGIAIVAAAMVVLGVGLFFDPR